ncbi:MAG: DUF2948 family protein [Rhizobiales bacterium]|jgi:hypothetical protein|nr:DUF2948 family protein [Hyphomicrobiales bacterium]
MDQLKLAALDEDDLKVISAHIQDALMQIGDIDYSPARKWFLVPMNRFVRDGKRRLFRRKYERRRSVLHFEHVLSVRSTGIDRENIKDVLSLLAVRFISGEAPAGTIELVFAGGATIQLGVEFIEARLADLGPAWETSSRPAHFA